MADDLDDAIRDLYAGDPAEFVARRAALAKAHRDRAAEIKALRKPEKRAWVLDRAAAGDPESLARLVDAAGAAARAQEQGGDVRAATAALRDAVRRLAAATPDPGAATADLVAVAGDPAALDDLAAGRLARVPEGGGFGPLPLAPVAPSPPGDRRDAAADEARAAQRRRAVKAVAAAEQVRDRAAAALAAAIQRRRDAEAAEQHAADELDVAEAALAHARAELDALA